MLKNDKEREICDKYSARDENGKVHCKECPLNLEAKTRMTGVCKAFMHYDRSKKEWVFDEETNL